MILAITALFLFVPARGVFHVIYDLLEVSLISPLLVMLGAVAKRSMGSRPISAFSAELSYPLYAIHLPTLGWIAFLHRKYDWLVWPANALAVIALLPASYALARYYDAPVRRRLARFIEARPSASACNPVECGHHALHIVERQMRPDRQAERGRGEPLGDGQIALRQSHPAIGPL